MDGICIKKGITKEHIALVLRWTNAKNAGFLRQYAGNQWKFPLTSRQVEAESDSIYSIYFSDVFVGMIQVIRIEEGNAHIGRFLLDPGKTGQGIGTEALNQFCALLFEDPALLSITLMVYEFNKSAQRCYSKCGFSVLEELFEDGKLSRYKMKKVR